MNKSLVMKTYVLSAFLLTTGTVAFGQKAEKTTKVTKVAVANDTTKTEKPKTEIAPSKGPSFKKYAEVITNKAETKRGLFITHKVDDRYFFEIPDSMLNQDFLVMTRVSRSGVDLRGPYAMTGYPGDEVNSNVIAFEKGPNGKIYLLKKSFSEQSSDASQAMFMAVNRSNMQPIVQTFDIKVLGTDSTGTVIDMTDYISGDNTILHFSGDMKRIWKIGGIQSDKSQILGVQSFPFNTNIKTIKTFAGTSGTPDPSGGGNITLELNTSLIALPNIPLKPRYVDPRVGYFSVSYVDFDENPQGIKRKVMAKRWRLEPKDEDIEKYKRGELVEPKKPIVIYIDPATPEKWVPYLIQGVNDWQKAFEKAGFKNAVIGKRAPTPQQDSTWSIDDARNSVLIYKASAVANASGPSTADPRSGEILETHINWYHNVMETLRNWYMIQAGAVDPRARKMEFDDALMGELIRFVSSHEVGHTLGLMHNFISSTTTPVERLRDKEWVEKNGHTPSIMDYARFNYVAQPEDNISEKGIFPRIGDYDDWSVEWGYKWTEKSIKEETEMLSKLTTDKQSNKRLWFGTEISRNDPRLQNEDLGDNAMLASDYGVKNLKRIIKGLPEWTAVRNQGYDNLGTMYTEVYTQFERYVGHVGKNIGGVYQTPKTIEQAGPIFENVSKATQTEAMTWLSKNVFTTPKWLIDSEVSTRIGLDEHGMILGLQNKVLNRLFDPGTFENLIAAEGKYKSDTYTILDLMESLNVSIWNELKSNDEIDVYRRNLQKSFVSKIGSILNPSGGVYPEGSQAPLLNMLFTNLAKTSDRNDVYSVLNGKIKTLRIDIKKAIPKQKDSLSKYHLMDLAERLDKMLARK